LVHFHGILCGETTIWNDKEALVKYMSGAVTVTGSGDHLEKRLIRANLILVLTPYLIKYPQMNKNAG